MCLRMFVNIILCNYHFNHVVLKEEKTTLHNFKVDKRVIFQIVIYLNYPEQYFINHRWS